ncbi:hypothetical protein ABZ815_50755 [Nonomuraea sp. NPDC047529]|uniref:hypothetical protein n=1 Tax=Nonomuraea sp. NPDC047529 TaxID=3155623 RepID=UPI0033C1A5E0
MRRLLAFDERQELTTAHVRLLSSCMGISERTLWRWIRAGYEEGRTERKPHPRFVWTEDLPPERGLMEIARQGTQEQLFDARTGAHLGPAFLADAATAQQQAEVMAARRQAQQERERLLKAAAKKRRPRYAAVTEARAPQPLQTQTTAEAQAELDASYHQLPRHLPRPSGLPLPPPVAGWVRPGEHAEDPSTGDAAGG